MPFNLPYGNKSFSMYGARLFQVPLRKPWLSALRPCMRPAHWAGATSAQCAASSVRIGRWPKIMWRPCTRPPRATRASCAASSWPPRMPSIATRIDITRKLGTLELFRKYRLLILLPLVYASYSSVLLFISMLE